ncbi:MAG: metal-sensitive transcriptional regulator [Firmicutes bacterium]|nr:metal-sensitive transcriptional regulator [Bacillota bacterium]
MISAYRYEEDKENLMARLKRIEGQVKGIMRMVEDGRYCPDILQQVAATSGALDEVALILLRSHVTGCVKDAIEQHQGDQPIEDLMQVIRKVIRR